MDQVTEQHIQVEWLDLRLWLLRRREHGAQRLRNPIHLRLDDFQAAFGVVGYMAVGKQQMDIARDGMQWRADLVGDRRALIDHARHAFPLGELPLALEQGLVDMLQFVIALFESAGCLLNFPLQLFIELLDLRQQLLFLVRVLPNPPQHTVEMHGQLRQLVATMGHDLDIERPCLRPLHGARPGL